MGSVGASKTRSIDTLTAENPKLSTTIEKAFNKANLQGADADLYNVLYSYKALRELPESDLDIVYEYLAKRLGF